MKKFIFLAACVAAILPASYASAQEKSTMFNGSTNLQVFYDFGKDRKYATATLEGFYNDPWGNTFFFADLYFANKGLKDLGSGSAANGSYFEIERCLNFWQKSKLANLSLQVEYDGATWGSGWACFGLNYFFHSKDFKNTWNVALLYEQKTGYNKADTPLKFTGVWGNQDIFGVKGLRFSGFLDIWGNNSTFSSGNTAKISILSEPQLWYNVGQFFGCGNLNLGGEIELSYNFAGHEGFMCNPCLGAKWVF